MHLRKFNCYSDAIFHIPQDTRVPRFGSALLYRTADFKGSRGIHLERLPDLSLPGGKPLTETHSICSSIPSDPAVSLIRFCNRPVPSVQVFKAKNNPYHLALVVLRIFCARRNLSVIRMIKVTLYHSITIHLKSHHSSRIPCGGG